MVSAKACPQPQELGMLLAGTLPADRRDALLEHLESCAGCLERVEQLTVHHDLVKLLPQARQVQEPYEAHDDRIQQLLAALSPEKINTSGDQDNATVSVIDQQPIALKELRELLAPAQAPDELGRLGGYRVLKLLGAGGMGMVFQAEDPK